MSIKVEQIVAKTKPHDWRALQQDIPAETKSPDLQRG